MNSDGLLSIFEDIRYFTSGIQTKVEYIIINQHCISISAQKMSIPKQEEPCIYYDEHLKSKAKLQSKPNMKANKQENKLNKFAGSQKPPLTMINKQYFPDNGQSEESVITAKIRNNSKYSGRGLRPKLSSRSCSASEKSTKKQLCVEISKLTSQLENKNKALMRVKHPQIIKQVQVMELYRVIHYYQGKIKHLEEQIKRYEEALEKIGRECDEKSKHKSQVEEMVKMFQSMRKQNSDLQGKIQQKDYNIGNLEQKLHKQQVRLNFLQSKQSFLKKSKVQSASSSQSRFLTLESSKNQRYLGISSQINLKQKQQNYGNIHSKINKIELHLNFFKKQNQILQNELTLKEDRLHELEKQLIQYKEAAVYFKNLSSQPQKSVQIHKQESSIATNKKQVSNIRRQQSSKNVSEIEANGDKKIEDQYMLQKNIIQSDQFKQEVEELKECSQKSQISKNQSKLSKKSSRKSKISQTSKISNKILKDSINQQKLSSLIQNNSSISRASQPIPQSSKKSSKNVSNLESCFQSQSKVLSPADFIEAKKKTINKQIFKKIKYQLLTEQITFEQLIKFLIDDDLEPELLQQSPYNLKTQQAQQLVEWVRQILHECEQKGYQPSQTISQIIPKFIPLTLRMQNNMKIQVANQLMNREDEFLNLTQESEGKQIRQSIIQKQFKEWGLSQQHIDTVCKCYYEETGNVEVACIQMMKEIISRWGQK